MKDVKMYLKKISDRVNAQMEVETFALFDMSPKSDEILDFQNLSEIKLHGKPFQVVPTLDFSFLNAESKHKRQKSKNSTLNKNANHDLYMEDFVDDKYIYKNIEKYDAELKNENTEDLNSLMRFIR